MSELPQQPESPKSEICTISIEEFVRRLHDDVKNKVDKNFVLFLGAGCSVSSGIPAAKELVQERWLPRLRYYQAPHRSDLETWAKEAIPGYDPKNPALSYGEVIKQLFPKPADRQREMEKLCGGKMPSFGYAVLAQLITRYKERLNITLTTNFDDLVADAFYIYTEARPLIIPHESLAEYIKTTRTRPLVVKLHGDHRLSPRNTDPETQNLGQEIQQPTAMVLRDRGLIFMGYGGHDVSIQKLLDGLPPEALPEEVYWVNPKEPQGPIRKWLTRRNGIWVQSDFDNAMLLIFNKFSLPHPDDKRFNRVFENYYQKYRELSDSIQKRPAVKVDTEVLKKVAIDSDAHLSGPWKAIIETHQMQHLDPERADEIYRQAIKQFPNNVPLLNNYALFLNNIHKNHDVAEAMYKRALKVDPNGASVPVNYAHFLADIRKDYNAAEVIYKRALEANPNDTLILGNYADLLADIRKDYDAAETMYKRALEADPNNASAFDNYALFLASIRKNYDVAETMYKRALEADPNNISVLSNYANLLAEIHKDYDAAEAMYQRALETDPNNASVLGNYAKLLDIHKEEYDTAGAMYKRALKADPNKTSVLNDYARFLFIRKEYDVAEAMYKRALEVDSDSAVIFGNYAILLQYIHKDYDAAEAMYKRALEVDPNDSLVLNNYANFLNNIRKDYDAAEAMYKRALKCTFYRFLHGQPSERMTALRNLRKLLEQGVRTSGWDLSRNIERALADGHEEKDWLAKLAAVVNDEAQLASLNDWPAWQRTT